MEATLRDALDEVEERGSELKTELDHDFSPGEIVLVALAGGLIATCALCWVFLSARMLSESFDEKIVQLNKLVEEGRQARIANARARRASRTASARALPTLVDQLKARRSQRHAESFLTPHSSTAPDAEEEGALLQGSL